MSQSDNDHACVDLPVQILLAQNLSLGAKLTYAALLWYEGDEGIRFPIQQRLANDLSVSVRSIRTYLHELREARAITRKRRGLNRSNQYFFLDLRGAQLALPGRLTAPTPTERG